MRKETVVTVHDDGKDLKFKIRQMSATQTERWLIRLALLVAKGGMNIDLTSGSGLNAIVSVIRENPLKLLGALEYEAIKPLIDELMKTCSRVVDGRMEMECTDEVLDSCITSFANLLKLRTEVMRLNFDFFTGESGSRSQSSAPVVVKGKA